jgi:hypothetical protein
MQVASLGALRSMNGGPESQRRFVVRKATAFREACWLGGPAAHSAKAAWSLSMDAVMNL